MNPHTPVTPHQSVNGLRQILQQLHAHVHLHRAYELTMVVEDLGVAEDFARLPTSNETEAIGKERKAAVTCDAGWEVSAPRAAHTSNDWAGERASRRGHATIARVHVQRTR